MWLILSLSKKGGNVWQRCKHSGHPISFADAWFRDGPIRAMNSHGPSVAISIDTWNVRSGLRVVAVIKKKSQNEDEFNPEDYKTEETGNLVFWIKHSLEPETKTTTKPCVLNSIWKVLSTTCLRQRTNSWLSYFFYWTVRYLYLIMYFTRFSIHIKMNGRLGFCLFDYFLQMFLAISTADGTKKECMAIIGQVSTTSFLELLSQIMEYFWLYNFQQYNIYWWYKI